MINNYDIKGCYGFLFCFEATTFAPLGRELAMRHITQRGALGYEVYALSGRLYSQQVFGIEDSSTKN